VSKDLTPLLAGWDHDPDELQVRIVAGDDGRDKLQTRVELGVHQMELDGRPDGARPFGRESLLDHHEAEAAAAPEAYRLDPDDCAGLMREGTQYYQRYLALFHLRRFDLVARDTERNLRLFRFVVAHARRKRDAVQFDQYRPYVTMMNARARGMQALDREDVPGALAVIDGAIDAIRAFLREYDQDDQEAQCGELAFLLRWRREVEDLRTVGPVERLEQQLALAVSREQYEEAARLRDQIRRLREPAPPAPRAIPDDRP
jgi:hypothetical protein